MNPCLTHSITNTEAKLYIATIISQTHTRHKHLHTSNPSCSFLIFTHFSDVHLPMCFCLLSDLTFSFTPQTSRPSIHTNTLWRESDRLMSSKYITLKRNREWENKVLGGNGKGGVMWRKCAERNPKQKKNGRWDESEPFRQPVLIFVCMRSTNQPNDHLSFCEKMKIQSDWLRAAVYSGLWEIWSCRSRLASSIESLNLWKHLWHQIMSLRCQHLSVTMHFTAYWRLRHKRIWG